MSPTWGNNGVWQNLFYMVKMYLEKVADSAEIARTLGNFGERLFVCQIGLKLQSTHVRFIY